MSSFDDRVAAALIAVDVFPHVSHETSFVHLSDEIYVWLKDGVKPGK